jgi:hypothetical protein
MLNFPGFDLTKHIVTTWSNAFFAQADTWNDAWKAIREGKYDAKAWCASLARIAEVNAQAIKDTYASEIPNVPWVRVVVSKGLVVYPRVRVKAGITTEKVETMTVSLDTAGGKGLLVGASKVEGDELVIRVQARDDIDGERWIVFVFERVAVGPPLGVVLVTVSEDGGNDADEAAAP